MSMLLLWLSNFSIQNSFRISLEVTDIVPFYGIDKTKNLIARLRDFNIVEKVLLITTDLLIPGTSF